MAHRSSHNVLPRIDGCKARSQGSEAESTSAFAEVCRKQSGGIRSGMNQWIFLTALLAVSLWHGELWAQRTDAHTFNRTTIQGLNSVLSGVAQGADNNYTLQANDSVVLNMNVFGGNYVTEALRSPFIVVSKESMNGTTAQLAYSLQVNKRGPGLWRLDQLAGDDGGTVSNNSVLSAQGGNYFTVEGGRLELMKGSTITLNGTANQVRFQLNSGTTLNARGDNVITAESIVLGDNVTLGVDMTNFNLNVPILKLAGNVSLTNAANKGELSILGFKTQTAEVTVLLLDYNYTADAPDAGEIPAYAAPPLRFKDYNSITVADKKDGYKENYTITVRGELWDDVVAAVNNGARLNGQVLINPATPPTTGGQTTVSIEKYTSTVGTVNWTGATNNNWNATSKNWQGNFSGIAADTFLHGDNVRFSDLGRGNQEITIQKGGVQIGDGGSYRFSAERNETKLGMIVDGGSYTFVNADDSLIGIDGPGKVLMITPDGAIIQTQVTFQSANSYWGGTEVDNALLTLKHSGAVGTGALKLANKSKLTFDTDGTAPNVGTPATTNDIFYNDLEVYTGTEIIKEGENTLRIDSLLTGDLGANTTIKNGVLQNNIPQGVLTIYAETEYHSWDPLKDRAIAGLSDGPTGGEYPTPNGGRVLMANGRTLTIDVVAGANFGLGYEFSGKIEGTNAHVVKTGRGTQIFSNEANTYSGGTTVKQGTLIGKHTFKDGDLKTLVFQPFGPGAIEVEKDAILKFDIDLDPVDTPHEAEYVATVHNTIEGEGNVVKEGYEILDLTAVDSSYTGYTDVKEGKLRIQSRLSTGLTSYVNLYDGTMLQFDDMSNPDYPADALMSYDNPYDRNIIGEGGVEVLAGDWTNMNVVYVSGTNSDHPTQVSNYIGDTILEEKTELHLLNPEATGKTDKVILTTTTSNLHLDFGSKLDENGKEIGQLYDRYITGAGNLIKDQDGTAVLGYTDHRRNDYTGTTTVEAGTLKLLYAQATGTNDAYGTQNVTIEKDGILELAFEGDYNKGIKGEGVLAKNNPNDNDTTDTVTYLQGKSTYSGGTYIYGGTLSYSDLNSNTPGNLGTGGVSFLRGGGTLQNRNEVANFDQQVYIYGGSTATFETLKDLTVTGNHGITHKDVSETDPYYNAEDPRSHFVKTGLGTMSIGNDTNNTPATWNGTTTVKVGRLENNIPFDTALTVEKGHYQGTDYRATYYTGKSDRQVSALYGEGIVETEAGYTFTINNAEEDIFNGTITGGGNLEKKNVGTLYLYESEEWSNDYSGSTAVRAGTLVGDIAFGTDLTVDSGATYKSDKKIRTVGSLQGAGTVDMENKQLTILQLNENSDPIFNGTIVNGSVLIKSGPGKQTFGGLTYTFSNHVDIQNGTLQLSGTLNQSSILRVGTYMNVGMNGTFILEKNGRVEVGTNFNVDGTLKVNVGNSNIIAADTVTLGDNSNLDVTGISENDIAKVIIRSNTAIEDNFQNVTVAGTQPDVDYLILGVTKSADKKEIMVGQSLTWYAANKAHGDFTIVNPDGEYTVGVALNDVRPTNPDRGWDGKTLTKLGLGTLILAEANGYTGQTLVKEGTLKLTNELAVSDVSEIVLSDAGTLALDFNSVDNDGNWSNGLYASITGTGRVVKTGHSTSVLSGTSTYTGPTYVQQGTLLVDGSIDSHVWVRAGAAFGGNGTVDSIVTFEDGSAFFWRFGTTEEDSDMLTITGNVHIGDNVMVKPNTNTAQSDLVSMTGWKILQYGSGLYGEFAGVDHSNNPFYDFELDYSENGYVKINGHLRDTPRALSDIVSTSLMMAQTRMYRTAFQQVSREWLSYALPEYEMWQRQRQIRGQAPAIQRTAWMTLVGRGDEFASTHFNEKYDFQSYGVQAGLSFLSNPNGSFGLLFGREEGKLSSNSDQVKNEDYYLGLYYAQRFFGDMDFRAYIGGGWQDNKLTRYSNEIFYGAKYNGNTFNADFELGRNFATQRGWTIRPYIAADLEVVRTGGATEKAKQSIYSNEYRRYEGSELARFFLRVGVEGTKSWQMVDFNAGINAGWNVGDDRAKTKIFYPALGNRLVRDWVIGESVDMGRFEIGVKLAMNWYLTQRRNAMFFLEYRPDVYLGRDGDTVGHNGGIGISWKY